jgi:outer membrane protein TolC
MKYKRLARPIALKMPLDGQITLSILPIFAIQISAMKFNAMLKSFLILILAFLVTSGAFAQNRTLDYYLSTGLRNSPLLNDYHNQLQSGSLDSLLALAAFKPQVNISSQVLYAPAGSKIGYDQAITNGGNYAATIGVKQVLFNTKIKSAQSENINLLKQTLEVNKKLTQVDLKKSITLQYITAYADFSQIQFTRNTIGILTGQQKVIKQLVESGIYQMTDLMNLSVTITAQEIAGKQVFIQYKNDIALLNLLSGIIDTTTVELIKPELILTALPDIQQSPVMLQSKIDSLKNNNSKSLIDLNYRPKLEAFADAGFMAIKPINIPQNFGTSFGLNFSLPVYDGKQRELEYKKIEINEKSRMLYRDYYSTQYWQQYRQLLEQLMLNDDLIRDINLQLLQQKELIDLYKTVALENAMIRITDYLAVINNYSNTQNSLTIAEMTRLQLINQLNFLR